ncbi:probable beta-D-xylosidase 2 [Gigantopelta aegis]|uniref:probable beta-D-xylosidase 2 n=1 Tax=Gigantopelta aegis TaxID=1735272 RepID=UPI001B8883A4|nr:probable beta-D-xylosidase 2 [Gigantopelta aegis]
MATPLSKILILFYVHSCIINGSFSDYPFRNTSLPFDERVDDLVTRLKLDEIILQMAHGGGGSHGGQPDPPIARLGIKPFQWSTECLRGVAMAGNATSFPQAIGLASSFNAKLIHDVAEATSEEVRAKHNDFVKRGIFHDHTGLGCWSPVINIMRHPLWGRNQETYGEDPYLTGILARHFVSGLQGNHPRYIRAVSTCKHFDAYGGPEDLPVSRQVFNAKVSERDLRTTFLPQFQACTSLALGVMCSYNSVNGIPACANKRLLTDILRKEWNYKGYIVTDAGAAQFIIQWHHYYNNSIDAAAGCVNAGVNLELVGANPIFLSIGKAIQLRKLTEDLVRERVKPLFFARMRLGEFDPPEMNPYNLFNLSVIQSLAHRELSLKAAMQSFVLLKNSGGFLPLKSKMNSIAIFGPLANNKSQLMGDYAADVDPFFVTTPLHGLAPLAHKVLFTPGCSDTKCKSYNHTNVKLYASLADLTILCLGTGQSIETENFDRDSIYLPGKQQQLLEDAIKYSKGPVIVLLFSGGPLDIRLADNSIKIMSIIQCSFPAQAAGVALLNILIGNGPNGNPAGRLPYTWYASQEQVPNMTDYHMANKTYRYFDGTPLYPFGFGLSYTSFFYSNLNIDPTKVKVGQTVTVKFNMTNSGPRDGDEVYEVYISWLNATVPTPRYQLVGFGRVQILKGQTISSMVIITKQQMAVWVDDKGFVVEPGDIRVYVGGQLPNQKKQLTSNILSGTFTVYSCSSCN